MNELSYQIKTHRVNRGYNQPHFFLLNKGLNSGRPMKEPCPNCFTITTKTEEQRNTLFYLCFSLQIGRYFSIFIKGSVVPFITIDDTRNVLNKALSNYKEDQWQSKVEKLIMITIYENNLKDQLKTIGQLKIAILRT